jgi:penicillin-binding protein-related factor A (putative recombinase)
MVGSFSCCWSRPWRFSTTKRLHSLPFQAFLEYFSRAEEVGKQITKNWRDQCCQMRPEKKLKEKFEYFKKLLVAVI